MPRRMGPEWVTSLAGGGLLCGAVALRAAATGAHRQYGGPIFGDPATGRVARSVYLDQVRQIFPWELVGREAELAELAAFCTAPDGGSYVWWQGPAWAGKSALMAWFVLHPPERVRVVSFFITAR